MNPARARERFEGYLAESGVPLAALTPQQGLEVMLRFYADDPAEGDLSFQWGCVTRYGEEMRGFSLSRRFEVPWPDPSYTLSLSFKIGPPALMAEFPPKNVSCTNPEGLEAFRSTIEGLPSFRTWGRSPAPGVALACEDLDSWAHALFDRWGRGIPSGPS